MVPSFSSLRGFLRFCDQRGELAVIDREVDPQLEVCEIAERVMRRPDGGKALLFNNVRGSKIPLAVNILGSENRIAWALGGWSMAAIEARIAQLVEMQPPNGWRDAWACLKNLSQLRHLPPKTVRRGPAQEVVEPTVDLRALPVLTTWPDDAGPFITYPMVFSRGGNGRANCGMYRMQVFNERTTGMHWQRQKDGRRHADDSFDRIPVAVALGGPPVLTWAATAPLPPDIFEMLLAGFLQRRRVPMVRCGIHDLLVPAEADFVLEGWVDPKRTRVEGPFGDHTGYYSQAGDYPEFHVERITRRADAIFPATVVGLPPKEDKFIGLATERLFLPLLRRIHGEIRQMHLPPEGVFHNLVLTGIRKRFPGHAHKAFHAIWGTGQMMFTKVVVAVDEDVDVHNPLAVLAALDENWHASRDTSLATGPLDSLDHACPRPDFGGKVGLDATRKFDREEGSKRVSAGDRGGAGWSFPMELFPEITAISVPPEAEGRLLLLCIHKTPGVTGLDLLKRLRSEHLSPRLLLVAVFDDPEALRSAAMATVVGGNNLDPSRDLVFMDSPRPGGALGIDATSKLAEEGYGRGEWPKLIRQDPVVVANVDNYWQELKI